MITKIDHIGVAVKSISETLKFFQEALQLGAAHMEDVPDQKLKIAFLQVGDSNVELLEATDDESAVARFIAKNGEGLQHLAFTVDDIDQSLARLKELGIRLIDNEPRQGAGGARIAFIHPKSTGGTLVELCQRD